MTLAFLFPGQGSQSPGMGAELFDAFPDLLATAEDILGYSVTDLCLDGGDRLSRTEFAQPALYVVNALAYLRHRDSYGQPSFLAGHSLGEWSALFAGGCVDFETGLRLVRRRGQLMGRGTGSMVAVLGVPLDRLMSLLERAGVDRLDVANHNTPEQVVLAGPRHAARAVEDILAAEGVGRCVPLNVTVAAHSRYLAAAAREFHDLLREVRFREPSVPVISNVTGAPHTESTMAERLSEHLCRPVRWWDTLCLLARSGVDQVAELGPGEVLAKMWHKARAHLPPPAPVTPAVMPAPAPINAGRLGSERFRRAYGTRYAYLAGAMAHGVSGPDLLIRLARGGLMGFLGTAGRTLPEVAGDLRSLARLAAAAGAPGGYGINLPVEQGHPDLVAGLVELGVSHGLRHAEASGHGGVTAELVRWRFTGARRDRQGHPVAARQLVAKVSHMERAAEFLAPAPAALVDELRGRGLLTGVESAVARELPVSEDVCVEADSVWSGTARGGPALLPAVLALRDAVAARHRYPHPARVGAAGGLGDPAAVAAAFLVGADFVLTGSVNQCTPQARTSDQVKGLLAGLDLDDTADAPAGELFVLGGRSRVARRGTMFAARADTLYQLYRSHTGVEQIDGRTRRVLEEQVFRRPLAEVWQAVRTRAGNGHHPDIDRAERDSKHRMGLMFGWYVDQATRAAVAGDPDERLNYRIPCGPAMGAFNRYAAGGPLADWRDRHADAVALALLSGAADLLTGRFRALGLLSTPVSAQE